MRALARGQVRAEAPQPGCWDMAVTVTPCSLCPIWGFEQRRDLRRIRKPPLTAGVSEMERGRGDRAQWAVPLWDHPEMG